ncbi:hypothetical protein GN956_G10337 [Arapaima gigas]
MRLLSPPQREQLSVSSGWSDKTPPGHLTLLVPDGGAASAAAAVAFLRYEGINVSSDRDAQQVGLLQVFPHFQFVFVTS